jgi:hypothetical protein
MPQFFVENDDFQNDRKRETSISISGQQNLMTSKVGDQDRDLRAFLFQLAPSFQKIDGFSSSGSRCYYSSVTLRKKNPILGNFLFLDLLIFLDPSYESAHIFGPKNKKFLKRFFLRRGIYKRVLGHCPKQNFVGPRVYPNRFLLLQKKSSPLAKCND